MLSEFDMSKLGEIDEGRPLMMIQKAIKSATQDCVNRPGLSKTRKINITLELTPICSEDGVCEEVDVEVVSSASIPKSRSKPVNMRPHVRGSLLFNNQSQDDVHQHTIDELGKQD
jgi:hypothetical protein